MRVRWDRTQALSMCMNAVEAFSGSNNNQLHWVSGFSSSSSHLVRDTPIRNLGGVELPSKATGPGIEVPNRRTGWPVICLHQQKRICRSATGSSQRVYGHRAREFVSVSRRIMITIRFVIDLSGTVAHGPRLLWVPRCMQVLPVQR